MKLGKVFYSKMDDFLRQVSAEHRRKNIWHVFF